ELKYAVRGKTADAEITDVREIPAMRRSGPRLEIHYTFTDAEGNIRTEHETIPADTPPPETDKLPVQYLPGVEKSSRIAGRARIEAVFFFFGSLLWLAWSMFKLAREANTP